MLRSDTGHFYDDFRDESDHNNFLYQIWLHSVQITVGLKF